VFEIEAAAVVGGGGGVEDEALWGATTPLCPGHLNP
jgi:hypothetical protein